MKRSEIIRSLRGRELISGLGYLPLVLTTVGTIAAVVYYAGGDLARAIFWLVVVGLSARWLRANLETLLSEHDEPGPGRAPFSRLEIEKQDFVILKAWNKAMTLGDSISDQFAGRTIDAVEVAEMTRLNREYEYAEKTAKREALLRDLMVQANARVAVGRELLSAARSRVLESDQERRNRDLIEYIEGKRSAAPDASQTT
jgi:hypothetical protein